MARNYPANTREQKCWEETIHKERDARLGWFEQLKGRTDGGSGAGESKQYEVFKRKIQGDHKPIENITARLPKNRKPQMYNKKATTNLDDALRSLGQRGEGGDGSMVEMRPASPATRQSLYRGFTKEGAGRHKYLHERHQVIPEAKFEFPLLSSWEYGWRLDDVIRKDDIKAPTYGRGRIVQDTFYRRGGIYSAS